MHKRAAPNSITHEAILEFFKRPGYAPMTVAELAAAFSVRDKGRETLEQLLHKMVMNGEIVTSPFITIL